MITSFVLSVQSFLSCRNTEHYPVHSEFPDADPFLKNLSPYFKEPREWIPNLAGQSDNPIWLTGLPSNIG